MIRISLLFAALTISLFVSSCSYVTVIRTKELKTVESNLSMKVDSLELTIDSLMKEQRRAQNRTSADIRLILSSMAKNNEVIKARLEETHYRLEKINEKSDSILTKKPEPTPVAIAPVENETVDSTQLSINKELQKAYEQSREAYNSKDFKTAFKGFKKVYEGHSEKSMAEKALFWAASCYEESGKSEGALKYYHKLIEEFPAGKKLCMSKLKLAHLAEKLKKQDLMKETLKSIVTDSHCSGTSAVMQAEEKLK
jgi:TolA-binding protein